MSIMDNEGHDPQGFLNGPQYRSVPKCKLCNDTGEQRYWEGRWRDEKADNERLRSVLLAIMQLDGRNDLPDAWTLARAALEPQT